MKLGLLLRASAGDSTVAGLIPEPKCSGEKSLVWPGIFERRRKWHVTSNNTVTTDLDALTRRALAFAARAARTTDIRVTFTQCHGLPYA